MLQARDDAKQLAILRPPGPPTSKSYLTLRGI